jgi:hypothetical protein
MKIRKNNKNFNSWPQIMKIPELELMAYIAFMNHPEP